MCTGFAHHYNLHKIVLQILSFCLFRRTDNFSTDCRRFVVIFTLYLDTSRYCWWGSHHWVTSAASWVKKIREQGVAILPTDETMGAQKFNFARIFSQNGGFSTPNFVFWRKFFRRKFSDRLKFRRGAIAPLPLPPSHDATEWRHHRVTSFDVKASFDEPSYQYGRSLFPDSL